jgi:hypothetical protein
MKIRFAAVIPFDVTSKRAKLTSGSSPLTGKSSWLSLSTLHRNGTARHAVALVRGLPDAPLRRRRADRTAFAFVTLIQRTGHPGAAIEYEPGARLKLYERAGGESF